MQIYFSRPLTTHSRRWLFLLVLSLSLVCLLSCSGTRNLTTKDDCQHIDNADKKLSCYSIGIRTKINNQFHSDLQDYTQLTTTFDAIQDVNVSVTLTDKGEIDDIRLLNTSGDTMLDNFFMQTIKNASPFALPTEPALRQKLKHFAYSLSLL